MRFLLGVAVTLTALMLFLFGESCLNPAFRQREYEALIWMLAIIWGAYGLVWAIANAGKKQKGEEPARMADEVKESEPFPEDDWETASVELRATGTQIVKAIERQNQILERIESRRER